MVRIFEDDGYSPCARLSDVSLTTLERGPIPVLFPNLVTLRIDVRHALSIFLSPSIIDLTLLVTRRQITADKRELRKAMRNLAPSLPNVELLRIDGDSQLEEFHVEISRLCRGLPRLRDVVLSPYAVSGALMKELGMVLSLKRIRVTECGRGLIQPSITVTDHGIVTAPTLPPNAFPILESFSFLAPSPENATSVLLYSNFPYVQLTSLWIRFPRIVDFPPGSIRDMLRAFRRTCVFLRRLTLRFAPTFEYSHSVYRPSNALRFEDLEPVLSFPVLEEFCVDHFLPLLFDEEDIPRFARRAHRMKKLWLNPFPTIHLSSSLPVRCLSIFAIHCVKLESLGLFVDGKATGTLPAAGVRPFKSLRELFVGWSQIELVHEMDHLSPGIDRLVEYLSRVLPPFASVSTLMEYSISHPWDLVDGDMRACWFWGGDTFETALEFSFAWKAVAGMARFVRARRVDEVALVRY